MMDIVLSFITAYSLEDGSLEVDLNNIVIHYMFSPWFTIDLFSVIPFDLIFTGANVSVISIAKCIRIIRVARLVKIMNKFANANYAKIVMYIGAFLLLGHILGSFFYAIANDASTRLHGYNITVTLQETGEVLHVDNLPQTFDPNRFYRLPYPRQNETVSFERSET